MLIRRIIPLLLTVATLFTLSTVAVPAAAAETITETVNIATANKNMRGPGYDWANRTDVLTLDGLHIDTEDPYGLRLPANCTVVLKGTNTVKAAKYGISCSGTIVVKGSGSLTIEAGEIGIYLISQDTTQKVRLIDGTYEITAGTYGVYSDAADFSFIGSSMNIITNNTDGAAISGRVVNLLGGTFSANAPVESTHQLFVDGINLNVAADRSAFTSKTLTVRNLSEEYNGENSFTAKSTKKDTRTSILFGENVSGWVDYVLLAVAAIGIAAAIVVPVLRKKKKTEELYKRLEAEGYDVVK